MLFCSKQSRSFFDIQLHLISLVTVIYESALECHACKRCAQYLQLQGQPLLCMIYSPFNSTHHQNDMHSEMLLQMHLLISHMLQPDLPGGLCQEQGTSSQRPTLHEATTANRAKTSPCMWQRKSTPPLHLSRRTLQRSVRQRRRPGSLT